jgi:2,4-dienoyl-CoA reductase-like NADH-dependent reductase (Old Yellow Enzyme family)
MGVDAASRTPTAGGPMTYRHLLEPIRLGPVELRNRVVSTSHQTSLVHDHVPTDDLVAYHEARARGGAAAIFIEATAVHPSGLLTAHTIGGFLPAIVPAYRRLGDAVREHGSRLFLQLFHGGREQISVAPRAPAVAPSAVPTLRFHTEPRSLTRREIRELVDGFAEAARKGRQGGVDGMEVSMSHGYLAAQFFSGLSNRRDDDYNGDLDARLRFAREVLGAVREAAGDAIAVGVRLAADEAAPGALTSGECARIGRALCRDGLVDFVDVCIGYSATYAGSVGIVPPPPVPGDVIEEPAQAMRAAVRDLPLIATSRVVDLASAERLIADGTADLVGMTRAMIADPDLVRKATEDRAADVIACVGCNQGCIGHYHAGVPIGCLVNPRTGRERTLPRPVPRPASRRVLVIGGGPAGIAAATEAARCGDAVTLIEREAELGGQLRLAGRAPAHEELWRRYRGNVARDLAAAGVDVRLGTAGTAAAADGHDLVIVATGARPYRPPLAADLPFRVVQAWEAIADPTVVDGPALVADWGGEYAGLDAAEVLAAAGLPVELACAAPTPGDQIHQYQRNLYLARLDLAGVRIRHHLELLPDGSALRHVFSARIEAIGPITTLVLAQGRAPDDGLWQELEGRDGVVRVGDVLGPRSAEEAILEGTLAAR